MKIVMKSSSLPKRFTVVPFLKNIWCCRERDIDDQMKAGVLAGYPLLGLKATLYDGSFHDVDSNENGVSVLPLLWRLKSCPRGRCGIA